MALKLPPRLTRPAKIDPYPHYDGCGGAVGPQNDITTTLFTAAMELEKKLEEGAHCPCCQQYAKVYERKLNSGMAASLVWLVRAHALGEKVEGFVDIATAPKFVLRSRELGKLVHWDLVETKVNRDPKKRSSGLWRPTLSGMEFVRQQLEVPSHVYLYDNKVLGFSPSRIGILEALGSKFDYRELMGPLA